MRRSLVLACCCVWGIVASADPALGQLWSRRHGYPNGYGGWGDAGVVGSLSATSQYNTGRNVAAADQMTGQVIAARQSAAMQSNINNMMMSQAQTQTQAILGRQAANKDAWFQVEQQQAAQRRASAVRMPPMVAPATSFEPPSSPAPVPAAAKSADDVMQWPAALQDPRFAPLRAQIEAPYRRTPGKMSYPTAPEYLAMLQPITQMRGVLGQMTAELTARDYLDAEKFLDLIARQAQEQAKKKA